MIRAVNDPAIINEFAQHRDIAEAIGGPLDFSGAMRETAVYLFGAFGGFCFEWTAPGTYEVHAMLTKAGRGPWGFAAAKQARDMIGAERLWARIDPANKPLALFAMKAGFREVERRTLYQGETPHEWRIFEWRKECPLQ